MEKNKNLITSVVILILVIAGGAVLYTATKNKGGDVNKYNPGFTLSAGLAVGTINSPKYGAYLTDRKGMTLYTFASDTMSKSSCAGDCLKKWPAFIYDDKNLQSATDLPSKRMKVIKRNDGQNQYAYGFQPVYYYYGDTIPGDTKGNGIGGKWSIIQVVQ